MGAYHRSIGLTRASCCLLHRCAQWDLIEHDVGTLVMQRVVGIALGYESLPSGRRSHTCGT